MDNSVGPALTPEQWEARDYRQPAKELDEWAKTQGGPQDGGTTEYVAKLGLSGTGAVIVMNRAHDRVLIPPPARAQLAAFALVDQPFGFTRADAEAVVSAADRSTAKAAAELRDIARRLQALLPPR